jgi:protein-S-isoprenylcysteine O-methyltransferase Ste14
MRHFVLAGLWVLWCVIHSGMISVRAAQYFRRRFGTRFRFYRLVFNGVSVVTIIPLFLYERSIREQLIFRWEGILIPVQVMLLAIAVLLFIFGGRHYDMLQFLGLRQIRDGTSHGALTESGRLDTTGILGFTRHPWYLAAILFVWAGYGPLYLSTLITKIILTVYLVVGTHLEEQKLLMEYGEEYRRYQKQVPMLVPLPRGLTRLGK